MRIPALIAFTTAWVFCLPAIGAAENHAQHPKAPQRKAAPKTVAKKAPAKPKGSPFIPQLLREVEDKYAKAETMFAEFTQVNESSALGQSKTTSGVVMVKRPDKVRWETTKPDKNLLVSDGRRFWYYTPPFDEGEHGQLIEKRASQVQSQLAHALLSGRFSIAKDMQFETEGATRFALKPKPGTAATVKQARIEIDPIHRTINKVVLDHQGGNRSTITLSKIELGKKLDDELFHFVPPPGTDRVKE